MTDKKAVEISMNTIIIAAIALLVLIVVVLIFTGQTGKFTRGINDCAAKGGLEKNCETTSASCVSNGGIPSGSCIFYDSNGKAKDPGKNDVCCVYKKK